MIIPALLMNAFNVILARTYIQSNMPAALSEAAQIDGATEFRIFGQVALPLCKPIIATIGLFIGLGYWNDWMNGLYYVTDSKLFSVQQLLNNMIKNIEFLSKNANSNINLSSIGGGDSAGNRPDGNCYCGPAADSGGIPLYAEIFYQGNFGWGG